MARSTSLERLLVNDQLTAAGSFDNTASGLTADNVKDAIDELDTSVDALLVDQHVAVTLDAGDATQETLSLAGQVITVNLATTTTDGAFAATDKTKLDGIEAGATADQTAGEIKTLYESNADTNAFTDAEQTKLAGVETGATADQTGAEIKALYEAEADTNAFTDAEKTKLGTVETNAAADQVAGEVPVTLTATNYTAGSADVEAHLVGIHSEIGTLQTALVGGVTYVGGYNASTNTPDLEAPAGGAVSQGDMYTVTADGNFFTEAVTIGDVLIAEVDNPSALTDWTIVENNIEDAADVAFNNVASGLTATNVQGAIDEVEGRVDTLEAIDVGDLSYIDVNSNGTAASATGTDAIAIGEGSVSSGVNSVAIGIDTQSGNNAISIGNQATAPGATSIAIGFSTNATDGIVIGSNSSAFTASFSLGTSVTNDGVACIALGSSGTSIGALSNFSVAIGSGAVIGTDAFNSTALGRNAAVTDNVNHSIQLGEGTNSTNFTLQFRDNRIANAEGLYTSHTAVNYSPADADNVTSHFAAIDTELGNKADAAPQPATVNRETIGINKTLANGDDIYQHIITTTAGLLVNLPASPVNGTHFIIKNASSSTQNFTTNGVSLAPGNLYEVIYDGTEWVVL